MQNAKIFRDHLLSRHHIVSEEQQYWSTLPVIKKYMHFAYNLKLTPENEMSTILPLYDMMNKNLVQFDVFYSLVSTDESMVP